MLENETEVKNRQSQLFWPCEDTAREQPSIKKIIIGKFKQEDI